MLVLGESMSFHPKWSTVLPGWIVDNETPHSSGASSPLGKKKQLTAFGGWTNPSEKYANRQNGNLPQMGMKKTYLKPQPRSLSDQW